MRAYAHGVWAHRQRVSTTFLPRKKSLLYAVASMLRGYILRVSSDFISQPVTCVFPCDNTGETPAGRFLFFIPWREEDKVGGIVSVYVTLHACRSACILFVHNESLFTGYEEDFVTFRRRFQLSGFKLWVQKPPTPPQPTPTPNYPRQSTHPVYTCLSGLTSVSLHKKRTHLRWSCAVDGATSPQ